MHERDIHEDREGEKTKKKWLISVCMCVCDYKCVHQFVNLSIQIILMTFQFHWILEKEQVLQKSLFS